MALNNTTKTGFNNLPSYQTSGIPYIITATITAGDTYHIQFPYVTNFITFNTNSTNNDNRLKIGFSANSIDNNKYFTTNRYIVESNGILDPVLKYRCKEVYIKNSSDTAPIRVTIVAGLTDILSENFPDDYESVVYGL